MASLLQITKAQKALVHNNLAKLVIWYYGVVPFPMKRLFLHFHCRQVCIRDFYTFGIKVCVQLSFDSQSRSCRCTSDQADDDGSAHQWFSSPVLGDVAKHAVFNLVPFAGARRKMANGDA